MVGCASRVLRWRIREIRTIDLLDVIGDDLRAPEYATGFLRERLDEGSDTFLAGLCDVLLANGYTSLAAICDDAGLVRSSAVLDTGSEPSFRAVHAAVASLGFRMTIRRTGSPNQREGAVR